MEKNKKNKLLLKDYLISRGIVLSDEEAKREILAGNVINSNRKFTSSMEIVYEDDVIYLKNNSKKYVSRGGDKIESVFEDFHISVENKLCIDCGSSTGGFTDFLLQHGAENVICLDVGYGIIAHKLMVHPKVILIERTNIKHMNEKSLSELLLNHPKNSNGQIVLPADFITADLSFISLKPILPVLKYFIHNNTDLLLLYKPQFEVNKEDVPAGGVIIDSKVIDQSLKEFISYAEKTGFHYIKHMPCMVKGTKGNQEIFIHLKA